MSGLTVPGVFWVTTPVSAYVWPVCVGDVVHGTHKEQGKVFECESLERPQCNIQVQLSVWPVITGFSEVSPTLQMWCQRPRLLLLVKRLWTLLLVYTSFSTSKESFLLVSGLFWCFRYIFYLSKLTSLAPLESLLYQVLSWPPCFINKHLLTVQVPVSVTFPGPEGWGSFL